MEERQRSSSRGVYSASIEAENAIIFGDDSVDGMAAVSLNEDEESSCYFGTSSPYFPREMAY